MYKPAMAMQLKDYLGTTSGKLTAGSLALALACGGIVLLMGTGGQSMLVLTALLSLSITGFIAALVLGIPEAPMYVLGSICALPPIAGLYFALILDWRDESQTGIAVTLLALAAIAAGVGFVGGNIGGNGASD